MRRFEPTTFEHAVRLGLQMVEHLRCRARFAIDPAGLMSTRSIVTLAGYIERYGVNVVEAAVAAKATFAAKAIKGLSQERVGLWSWFHDAIKATSRCRFSVK